MSMAQTLDIHTNAVDAERTVQYLTFLLDDEEYGVEILRVQEIKAWQDVATHLPRAPRYIKGVINIRGTIVPIIDLRERFGLACKPYLPTTVVIILKVVGEGKERVTGIIVDAVSDVLNVEKDGLLPAPDVGGAVDTGFVKGLASVGDKMLIVLDIDQLLGKASLVPQEGVLPADLPAEQGVDAEPEAGALATAAAEAS